MNSSQQLYNQLNKKMSELVKVKNRKQLANWIWIIVGIEVDPIVKTRKRDWLRWGWPFSSRE